MSTPSSAPATLTPPPAPLKKQPYPFWLGGVAATIAASITQCVYLPGAAGDRLGSRPSVQPLRSDEGAPAGVGRQAHDREYEEDSANRRCVFLLVSFLLHPIPQHNAPVVASRNHWLTRQQLPLGPGTARPRRPSFWRSSCRALEFECNCAHAQTDTALS